MNAPCSTRYPGQIDKLLLKEPSPRQLRRLHAHLAGCPACQHRYNKIVLASRLFEGGPQALTVPSEGEIRRVGQEVMRRVRLVPDAEPARRQAWRPSVVSWVAAVATCGVVLAIALPLTMKHTRLPAASPRGGGFNENAASGGAGGVLEDDFRPRGSQEPTGAATGRSKVGVRAFCIARIAGLPQVMGLAPTSDGRPSSCKIDDVIKFAYTNRSRLPHLFLFGVDEKYAIKWYEPHPPERRSVPVKSDVSDEPLPRAVHLAVNHRAGQLRIFAVFTPRPLATDQVEAAVSLAQKRGTPLSRLDALPVQGSVQQSLLIRLEP